MKEQMDFSNKKDSEYIKTFTTRVSIICQKLDERGLLDNVNIITICLSPMQSTGLYHFPQIFATKTSQLPRPEKWLTVRWASSLLVSAMTSFVVLVVIQQVIKWLKDHITAAPDS